MPIDKDIFTEEYIIQKYKPDYIKNMLNSDFIIELIEWVDKLKSDKGTYILKHNYTETSCQTQKETVEKYKQIIENLTARLKVLTNKQVQPSKNKVNPSIKAYPKSFGGGSSCKHPVNFFAPNEHGQR